jgi:hypothetical protein
MSDYKLKGKKGRFNQKLFNKYDQKARDTVIKALGKDIVDDHPDPFRPDLIIKKEANCRYHYLELQVCTAWINDDFPYEYVYIYERKMKYGDKCMFLVLNKSMTRGYLFNTRKMEDHKPRRVKKYSREYVFDIPWNKCLLVYMEHLDPLTLELF